MKVKKGVRSEAEEEETRKPVGGGGRKPSLGTVPPHLSLSTTSSLSSSSTTSQARLVQSSLREGCRDTGPPQPPPRRSDMNASPQTNPHHIYSSSSSGPVEPVIRGGVENVGVGGPPSCSGDLGKDGGNARATCMQCYLSGHSDGSLDSVDPSTECSGSSGGGKIGSRHALYARPLLMPIPS